MSDSHRITPTTTIDVDGGGPVPVLTVHGTFDFTVHEMAGELFDEAFARFGPCLIVDLLDLDFLDSRATGLLIGCWKRAIEAGGWLALVAVERGAARVLWITGLAAHVPVFSTVAEALKAANTAGRRDDREPSPG